MNRSQLPVGPLTSLVGCATDGRRVVPCAEVTARLAAAESPMTIGTPAAVVLRCTAERFATIHLTERVGGPRSC